MPQHAVAVVGGGLAGCECAWQLARRGVAVVVFEMRPGRTTPAHTGAGLAELVCSNSLRSDLPDTAVGCLKAEMRRAGSLVMACAEATRVPAGKALAVDRALFSEEITRAVQGHPGITVRRQEIAALDDPALEGFDAVVVAAGPLASDALAADLVRLVGGQGLYFYDAIAPIVEADSVDMDKAYWGSRYRPEDDDYLNCPMDEAQYRAFLDALLAAEKVQPREFEREMHFEGCLPIEVMAERGDKTLLFGPLKPVGLADPRTGKQAHAVVQLRAENRARTRFNMVGFQTKLTYPEQRRVFRMIPGLERAEFERMGSIHRNTYVNAPQALTATLELRQRPGTYLAGQITGVEGYVESAACGLWLGMSLAARLAGREVPPAPAQSALGALLGHLRTPARNFQPSNVQFGLMPELGVRAGKRKRMELYAARAEEAFRAYLETHFPEEDAS
ncbi:methylenetetrahydrofolate--tRNA-(uracil(54)-C(5))-methyltransferase (FADH(2)-oxidizing) TrmFO [Desulfocurvus sp.]|uniref:methylenetetrahydrofolate--tRNA-(uracil(54)- C(5))-methyltransferase (FADH(2)-oxidizing) TrmFO n=1 Tax=Desulfocurvus sp. TaxID=2871698 RepID=UPI0025BCB023|nr:methylenetetrahydrofolate--tRNA-(uracil(54)-C(5))-methyltransferase (FADH(2)-oxidizing) TrmFO [Desulfocurvus sp.]MCK9241125.1 methylenetetrahydrofolate--tRNA-(uracil(54)-C(5))-methyltransferase (FADH(2)-oxidizing) TrmFO [Desulfocurvus sp.]